MPMDTVRLARMATLGYQRLRKANKAFTGSLRQYAGRFYGTLSTNEPTANPINLIYQAATTLIPNLVYREPKAQVGSRFVSYRDYAAIGELALNHLAEKINVRMTMRQVILDAIFMAGFVKIGLGVSGQTLQIDEFIYDVGEPYCLRISPNDMILGPLAETWNEQRLIGNKFRIDRASAEDSGMYDPDVLRMVSTRQSSMMEARDMSGGYASETGQAIQLAETIELVELWLPEEQAIVTLPWNPNGEVVPTELRRVEHEGPQEGPYKMLGFSFVPDNILPVAPAMIWHDLHIYANRIARKIVRQAERQKSILAYQASSWQDAQDIVNASDGESVLVEDVNGVKAIEYGGVSEEGYRYLDWAKQQFSEMAMNIDLLSGVRSDENTATQAEMLQSNSTIRLNDMQNMIYDFTGECFKQLFFYLHTDPLIELPLIRRRQGLEEQVVYTPEMRRGEWLDYNIKIRPYSMSKQDPNMKVRRLMEFCSSIIPSFAQAYQLLGPAFNIENAINIAGREMGIEDLDEIINSQALQQQLGQMQQALEMGLPPDPKVFGAIMGTRGQEQVGGQGAAAGGGRPQQPNPNANMAMGITPGMEANQMRHETEGELQATYG